MVLTGAREGEGRRGLVIDVSKTRRCNLQDSDAAEEGHRIGAFFCECARTARPGGARDKTSRANKTLLV